MRVVQVLALRLTEAELGFRTLTGCAAEFLAGVCGHPICAAPAACKRFLYVPVGEYAEVGLSGVVRCVLPMPSSALRGLMPLRRQYTGAVKVGALLCAGGDAMRLPMLFCSEAFQISNVIIARVLIFVVYEHARWNRSVMVYPDVAVQERAGA